MLKILGKIKSLFSPFRKFFLTGFRRKTKGEVKAIKPEPAEEKSKVEEKPKSEEEESKVEKESKLS